MNKKKKTQRVAIFVQYYNIGYSPSIINLLHLLLEKYNIDLYLWNVGLINIPLLKSPQIRVFDVRKRKPWNYIITNIIFRYVRIPGFFPSYKYYITFDPNAFVWCKTIYQNAKPFYYSLELHLEQDKYGLIYTKNTIRKERKWIHSIKGLIIQSAERERIFRDELKLSDSIPTFILPVTYIEPIVKEKTCILRNQYNIPENHKIALHLGGINNNYSCIEIAQAFSRINNWTIFFQGYSHPDYLKKFKHVIANQDLDNVIISEITYDDIKDVDALISSCHLGLAWYNDISVNFRTTAQSSGKIAAYLRFGMPVITNNYPGLVEGIEKKDCGVCISGFEEIPEALQQIERNYSTYSSHAWNEYGKTYWFEVYRKSLNQFLDS